MMKFNKLYNFKIISIAVASIFLIQTISYAANLPKESCLRVPCADKDRLKEALLFYDDNDFLKDASKEKILDFLKSKGIDLKIRKEVNVPVKRLRNIASIVNILPYEHLPKKIIIKRKNLFDKTTSGYVLHIFRIKKTKIMIYNDALLDKEETHTLLHEIGHTVPSSLQKGFWSISFDEVRTLRQILMITNTIFFTSLIVFTAEDILGNFPIHMPLAAPLILMIATIVNGIFYLRAWFKTDEHVNEFITSDIRGAEPPLNFVEDFAETYATYVLNGRYFREKAHSSEILLRKYEYMKKYIFGGIEYDKDANGIIVLISKEGDKAFAKTETLVVSKKDMTKPKFFSAISIPTEFFLQQRTRIIRTDN